MTPEERIVQLEAALALERAKVHELSAALAAAVSADAHAKRVAADRKAARAAQNRAAYERRKHGQAQVQHQIQRAESGAETHAESLPPPLDGSPPPSAPSSPSPLSSPPSHFSPSERPEAPAQGELVSVQPAERPGKQRKQREPTAAEKTFIAIQQMREEKCREVGEVVGELVVQERWNFAKQNQVIGALLKESREAQALFERAWEIYLADDGQRARRPAWSLAYFLSPGVRADYETRAAREAGEGEAA